MKCQSILAMLLPALLAVIAGVAGDARESPVSKVLLFIEELKGEITSDMEKENGTFTKFTAWANETITTAKNNIASGEEIVENCNRRIEELSGFEAAGGAEIAHAEKTLAENIKRQEEAVKVREGEAKDFKAATEELNASLAAMDDALSELGTVDATKTAGFLQRSDAPANRAAASIRKLLQFSVVGDKIATEDLQSLSSFASSGRKPSSQQFMQLERGDINGDYNAASGQVVGIIQTTKEDFEKDLADATEEENNKISVHAELMATMAKEKTDLETFLTEQKSNKGNAGKELSDKKTLRDETEAQLKADKKMLVQTEDTLKEKTYQFGLRLKLRKQELAGVTQALEILGSNSSAATFEGSAAVSFTQLRKSKANRAASAKDIIRGKAYKALQAAASKTHNLALARIAVQVKTTGYFDKVIDRIDAQIKFLREEEKEDVEHRDRCQQQLADSSAEIATLGDKISKASTKISRMEAQEDEMQEALAQLVSDINDTQTDIADRQADRDEEREDHLVALKHDKDALALIDSAIEQITKFFNKNKIDVGQGAELARLKEEPNKTYGEYETAPDAGFEDANYEGAKDSTKGLVGMMDMVREDMAEEVEDGQAEDEENQALYEKDYSTMKELLNTQKAKEISSNKALAELQADIEAKKEYKDAKTDEKTAEENNKENLNNDCAWVKSNFQSRREKRRAEIDGLVEAKALLAGAAP